MDDPFVPLALRVPDNQFTWSSPATPQVVTPLRHASENLCENRRYQGPVPTGAPCASAMFCQSLRLCKASKELSGLESQFLRHFFLWSQQLRQLSAPLPMDHSGPHLNLNWWIGS